MTLSAIQKLLVDKIPKLDHLFMVQQSQNMWAFSKYDIASAQAGVPYAASQLFKTKAEAYSEATGAANILSAFGGTYVVCTLNKKGEIDNFNTYALGDV